MPDDIIFQQHTLDKMIFDNLLALRREVGELFDADCITVIGPMMHGIDERFRDGLLEYENRKQKLAIVLDTPGGIVEIVERMVDFARSLYSEIDVIIPDRAMSAGTVFAMAADRIWMDNFSRLGPIDPQIESNGHLVPALSYLIQFKRLIQKSRDGTLTEAEFALLARMDLAELHNFEQARDLSHTLLKKWLANYKFKNWNETETNRTPVTPEMKERRALEIAEKLSDHQIWHSHGRGISKGILESELNLRIDDLDNSAELAQKVRKYHSAATEYAGRMGLQLFVHGKRIIS